MSSTNPRRSPVGAFGPIADMRGDQNPGMTAEHAVGWHGLDTEYVDGSPGNPIDIYDAQQRIGHR